MHLNVFNTVEKNLFKISRLTRTQNLFYACYENTRLIDKKIAAFQNVHQGKRCFIMGGGPSLKLIDPSLLKNEITFGVNGSFLIFDWLGFEPTYYVVEDFLVYEDRWKDIIEKVNNSICFFPIQLSNLEFDRPSHHYMRAIYEFNPRTGFPRFSEDIAKLVWIGGTVTYVCIQLAFFMGFEEVYLVGMDHNYVKPDHVKANGNVWQSHGEDPNHFHPDYFGAGYRWHDPMVWRMELAYQKAREVFEQHDRKIYNATLGGKLEVFERVNFNELF